MSLPLFAYCKRARWIRQPPKITLAMTDNGGKLRASAGAVHQRIGAYKRGNLR
jgi:hypothetical protein